MRAIRCAVVALLAAGIVAMVGAQPPRQFGGGGGDISGLVLNNTALQEELKITDAQKEKFKPLVEKQTDLAKRGRDLFAKGFKDFDKEKAADLRKEGEKLSEDVKKALDAELTADQKKRLKQIGVQMLGMGVFADPEGKNAFGQPYGDAQKATMKEVADALKLTDSQKSKIKDITEEYSKDRAAIRKDVFGDTKGKGAFDPEKQKDFQSKTSKLSAETMSKIADVLDDTQKKTWKELTGDAFDTSKLFQGGGGFRPKGKD
ncbi:MAG: Spy/CpxP family protein refolding chaperone [Planctomycetes bacterium]|nr:Spy/CpxP family protein refolding chaperone [Planctomycetota bacterium]